MRIVLTGASGIAGSFIVRACHAAGHDLTLLGQGDGWRLGQPADLRGHEALIHCAFAHLPGRYRGGEGDDPQAFRRANLDGSTRLFSEAADAGLSRILFLSSRAVHDGHPPGMILPDDLPPAPANLYGEVKALAEAHLVRMSLTTTAIRATGLYGPGKANKWRDLLAAHLAGHQAAPRIATELHVDDLAAAILRLLTHPAPPRTVNASDLLLDRRDLLAMASELTGCRTPLPAPADATHLRRLRCDALTDMGWRPGGTKHLRQTLPALLEQARQGCV